MDILELTRKETGPDETVGFLVINKRIECFVLEPPKLNNEKDKSCIPTGQYHCEVYFSKKFHCECLDIKNVPNRNSIAMHYGNSHVDTEGCLLPGLSLGVVNGRRAVLNSRDALSDIMKKIGDKCILTIKEDF